MSNFKLTYSIDNSFFFWKDIEAIQGKLLSIEYNKDVLGVPTPTPIFEQGQSSIFGISFETKEDVLRIVTSDKDTSNKNLINVFPHDKEFKSLAFFTFNGLDNIEGSLYSIDMSLYVFLNGRLIGIDYNTLEVGFIREVLRNALQTNDNSCIESVDITTKKDALSSLSGIEGYENYYYPPKNCIRFDFVLRSFDQGCISNINQNIIC